MTQKYPTPPPPGSYTPAYVPNIEYTTSEPDEGAAADNNGETGTLTVAFNEDAPYADTGNYSPKTQAQKAGLGNLTPGTIIAPDVGVSYAADNRGSIAPDEPYPSANTGEVAADFRDSNYVSPPTEE